VRQAEDGWFERDGADLHYLDWKPGAPHALEPPILLLHGLSSNARYWERVAQHLPTRRIIALDQRAHGLTGRRAQGPSFPNGMQMTQLVRDARALAEELELSTPVVVGHSWGATVALEVAASEPAIACALVFIDGPIQNLNRVLNWGEAQGLMQPPLPRYRSMQEAIADSKQDLKEAWGDDLEAFVAARVMPDGSDLILTLTAPVRLELLRGLYESRPESLWPRVGVPAVVLVAKHTFPRIARSTEDGINRLHEIAPHVALKRLDSPHDIPLYLPVEVADEIGRITATAEWVR